MKSPRAGKRTGRPGRRRNKSLDIPMDDQVFMLPWYLPKETYLAVRSILPNIHIAKMRYYFDDYGCIRCERRDVLYKANGLCEECNVVVRWRLAHCLKKRLSAVGVISPERQIEQIGGGVRLARELLRPFRKHQRQDTQ